MQLVDKSAGNSCHGNPQMQCSLLCFVSLWLIIEWGENGTQVHGAGKVLHELSLGKFLIGPEILCGLGSFLWKLLWWECPFCVIVVPSERWRHLQQAIYMGSSHHVSGGTCKCTLFSASLPLHKWKWSCGALRLSGWRVAEVIQQAPRVKYFHSFLGKSDRNLTLWPLFVNLDSCGLKDGVHCFFFSATLDKPDVNTGLTSLMHTHSTF